MIAAYKTCTRRSYLTSTFSIFYYGGEHINSQTTSKQVSTLCESTLSCCYLNATFIIRCIHRIFYYYCYFTKNNLDIVLHVRICTSLYIYFYTNVNRNNISNNKYFCPHLKTAYIKWVVNCSYFKKNRFYRAHLSSLFSFVLEYDSKLFLHFLMTRKLKQNSLYAKGLH